MSTKEFYTCSSITTPSNLVHLGATAHPILYSYEINTPIITDTAVADEFGASSAEVSEAIERVQQVILHNMAIHSGLTDCVVIAKQREGGSWRGMRRLLPQDRGSTSIVGVSLEPEDVVDENAKCSNDVSPTSNYIWDNENQIERISSSGTVEDESSSTPSAGDFFVDDDALVDARIDGKIGVRANNSIIQTRANAADANSNDSAFNFISTQSEPITRSSFTRTHDPVVSTELIAPRMATKCTVVQGHITLYTYDHDSYENIEVRAIDAIKQYMEDDTFVKQNLLNDVVLGVKFAGSPGYVTNRFGTPVSSTLGSDAPDVFTAPVMILIALGAILCVLVALFVGTSTRKKRKRYDSSYHNRDIVTKPHDKMSKDEQDVTMTSSNQSIDEKDATMTSSKIDCDFFYSSYTQLFEGVGSACSKRFSGFSNEAPTNIDDGPVYNETYETTANGNGGVRIHGVRSNADEKYEDYYDHDEAPPETNGLASLDSLRRPTTPGKKKKTPRRDYPSQSRVFSSPRFSRRSNDYDMFSDRAILRYDDELDERPGIEISLDQKSRLLRH